MSAWLWAALGLWLVALGVVVALFRGARQVSGADEHEEGV